MSSMTDERDRKLQGARLVQARLDAGYRTRHAAAVDNDWPPATYSSHERGTRTMGKDDAEKYAKRFRQLGAKTSAEHILFGTSISVLPSPEAITEYEMARSAAANPTGGYRVKPNATFEGEVKLPPRNGPSDIEELGITVGGLGDDDSAFAFNGQVIDMVTRPPGIANRKGVFALRVGNTSMVPKFEDGERVYVEPRKPAIGDYVVVELKPTEEGRPGKSFIKRLVTMNSARVEVEQFNPRGRLEFERDEIKDVFRVIPTAELLGM